MKAADSGGSTSGWQSKGTTAASTPPTADSVSGIAAGSSNQTLTFKYSSVNGYGYLRNVYALFNTSLSGVKACYIFYDKQSGGLYLYNDGGTGVVGPLAAGSSLSNSQCTLNGVGTTVSGSGNTLTMVLNLMFSSSFGGAQNIYMKADDGGASSSGWQAKGTLTVP